MPAPRATPSAGTGSPGSDSGADVHLGRQPVFDRAGSVVAYELLFRAPGEVRDEADRDRVTAEVLVRTFADFGLETVVGDRTAFLDVPRPFLVGRQLLPFPSAGVVLQVPVDLAVDEQVLAGLRRLAAHGFQLAVDGVTSAAQGEPLLALADVVKVDVRGLAPAELAALVERLRPRCVRLVAEGVETPAQLAACRDLDVAWFQGDLLRRPTVLSRRSLDSSSVACLRLLTALTTRDFDLAEIDAALRSDPGLSLRVLRAVHASAAGVRTRVRSVRQAVLLLGSRTLLGWVALLTLGRGTGADGEGVLTALVRGRMCELLAPRVHAEGEAAFTVGLLHGLQPLLGVSLRRALAELPLHPDVVAAAVEHEGPLGAVLEDVLAYERQEPGALLPTALLRDAYLASLAWTHELMGAAPRPH